MSDKKAERLINLVIALLATKRFLKKSEIFRMVDGYSGTPGAMDRMFERDKNELRSLGIDISVGDLDPLFDDEPGYRIFKDSYAIQLEGLKPADVAILSVAAKLWNDSVLAEDAQSGLVKLESLGLGNDEPEQLTFGYRYENPTANLVKIEAAILEERQIEFVYRDSDLLRKVEPYKIYLSHGFWYFVGKDISKNSIRNFKLSRVRGEISLTNSKFEAPENFKVTDHLPTNDSISVSVKIPEGKSVILRNTGKLVESSEGFDIYQINFSDSETALKELMRYGASAEVLAPSELRDEVIKILRNMTNV